MRQLNKDNRGLSLVELIISVLILSIIVAAVFTSLTTSLKTNQKATELFYAESAAANIVEEVEYRQYSSISRTTANADNLKWNTGSGIFTLHPSEGINEAYYTFSNDTTGATEYYREGTEEFIAKITFNKQEYVDNANAYPFAPIDDFSSETSILINPEMSGINFDDAATTFFLQSYRDKKYQEWLAEWEAYESWYVSISDESDRRMDNEEEPIKITDRNDPYFTEEGHAFVEKPPAFSCPDPDMDVFKSCIDKSFIIILNHRDVEGSMTVEEAALAETRLKSATCMVRYEFTEKAEYPEIAVIEHEREFVGFTEKITCNDAKTKSNCRSVYLLYRPLDDDFARDRITVVNNVMPNGRTGDETNIMNVFLVVQNKDGLNIFDTETEILGSKKHLKVDLPDNRGEIVNYRGNLRICSQAHLEFLNGNQPQWSSNTDRLGGTVITSDSQLDKSDRLLTTELKELERIYLATVELFSTRNPDDRLAILQTTIVEK